jgi:hypothetical protein
MKRYFQVILGGILVLWPMLAAPAQEPVRMVVAEQTTSGLAPVETRVQVDGVGNFAADDESDRLWSGHFVVGAGAYIIKPYFQNNPAFFTRTFTETTGVNSSSFVTSVTQHDFCWGLNAAPVIWLGYVSECGWGVRTRWWLFDQENGGSAIGDRNTTIVSAAPAGIAIQSPPPMSPLFPTVSTPAMLLASNLKLDVWDFEATRETQVGRWSLLFSGGFRYAHLSQDYRASQTSISETAPGLFILFLQIRQTDILSSGHNFNGAGPTLAMEARRPLGNSGLALFANLRGVMLFGESKREVSRSSITQLFNEAPSVSVVDANSHRDTLLPVAELEMGVEYSRTWGRVRPFLRTGLVAQTWFDAGSASSLAGDLGFLGLSVTAGLTY